MTTAPRQYVPNATLTAAADELARLAPRSGVNAAVVRMLVKELRDGGARLRGVDLLSAYPPQALVDDQDGERSGLIDILSTVRDLLVFAPIAITWWNLRDVLKAWDDAGYPGNLLQFWQDTPQDVSRLSTAALWVVAVLVAVAVLTGVILVLSRRDDTGATRRLLTAALAKASLVLAVPIQDGAVTAHQLSVTAAELGTSTGQLAGAIRTVGADLHQVANAGPGSALGDALAKWQKSADALSKLGDGLQAPATMMKDFVQLRTSVEKEEAQLRKTLQSLAERLEESTTVAVREGLGHTQVAEEVRRSAQQLGLAVERFLNRTDSLEILVRQVQSLLVRLETHGFFPPADLPGRDNADEPDRWRR